MKRAQTPKLMRPVLLIPVLLLPMFLILPAACSESSSPEVSRAPASMEDHECAACLMIVRDQPAPRGQLVHRDGTRVFFCSIADLVTYTRAPSPHGAPVAIHVEVMSDEVDPANLDAEPHEWQDVASAGFVIGGFERPVMGEPVLTFGGMAGARAAASRLGGRALSWDGLRDALGEDGRAGSNE